MKILYEDDQILVCYKEAGLPVQSARIGAKDLVSMLKTYLWQQGGEKGEPYLGIVHRLDQPVEGVLVFAKTPRAARELSAQVTDGRMKKTYHAVVMVCRDDIPEEGRLEDFLLKENKSNSSRVVPADTKGAKAAHLDYTMIKRGTIEDVGDAALAEIRLHTGRHHQIRVQMAHAGMPLCGDRKYADAFGDAPLALCAVQLDLIHPKTGKEMQFRCEPQGEYFRCI